MAHWLQQTVIATLYIVVRAMIHSKLFLAELRPTMYTALLLLTTRIAWWVCILKV